jgi:hypothetical protein
MTREIRQDGSCEACNKYLDNFRRDMPAVLLGEKSTEEVEGQVTYESETEPVEAAPLPEYTHRSAFMILVDNDGNFVFETNINAPVIPERAPTSSEIKGALSTILMDIQTQETAIIAAQQTVNAQMQMAKQMHDQAQTQAVLQQMRK